MNNELFFYIIQKLINVKPVRFENFTILDAIDTKSTKFDSEHHIIIHQLRVIKFAFDKDGFFLKAKYDSIKDVINNKFLSDATKFLIIDLFGHTTKIYFSLNKLLRAKLFKQPPKITTDLSLNTLSPKQNNVITIRENNVNYLFKLTDLRNIIINNLCEHDNFFLQSQFPKNPYTNLPFSIHNMYNIYYALKKSDLSTCILLHNFFLNDFSLKKFILHNEVLLKEEMVERFVRYSLDLDASVEIYKMLNSNKWTQKWSIDDAFPMKDFVSIFRPFLRLYLYNSICPATTDKNYQYKNKLNYFLQEMYKDNPTFGRKIIRVRPRRVEFIKNCLSYYELEKKYNSINFLTSPLSSVASFQEIVDIMNLIYNLPSTRRPISPYSYSTSLFPVYSPVPIQNHDPDISDMESNIDFVFNVEEDIHTGESSDNDDSNNSNEVNLNEESNNSDESKNFSPQL